MSCGQRGSSSTLPVHWRAVKSALNLHFVNPAASSYNMEQKPLVWLTALGCRNMLTCHLGRLRSSYYCSTQCTAGVPSFNTGLIRRTLPIPSSGLLWGICRSDSHGRTRLCQSIVWVSHGRRILHTSVTSFLVSSCPHVGSSLSYCFGNYRFGDCYLRLCWIRVSQVLAVWLQPQ